MTQNATKKDFKYMAYHTEAVEMRYLGSTHAEIAQKLTEKYKKDFRDDRVRRWFAAGGILEKMLEDHSSKENERLRNEMMSNMKKLTALVPKKYHDMLTKRVYMAWGKVIKDEQGNPIQLLDMVTRAVLKDFCELIGFKMSADMNPDPEDKSDTFIKKLEEITKEKNDAENETIGSGGN